MQFKFKRLEVSNLAKAPGYEIRAKADSDVAEVYIYDAIGSYFGISAQDFVRDLQSIKASSVSLRINSPGGDVFEARAMATAIKNHSAKFTAYVDGLAASAATTIALAADEVVMAEGSMFMIHNAWTLAMGDSREMAKVADMLEKINQQIANDYVATMSGSTYEEVRAAMDEETWYTADEAVANGIADRIEKGQKASAMWDLSTYSNAPKQSAAEPQDDFDMEPLRRRLALLERIA